MKKFLVILSVVVALIFAVTGVAQADFITESDSYSGQTNFQETLSIAQFDSSLGTLNSVKLTFDGSITSSVGFENTAASPYDADFWAGIGFGSKVDNSATLSITRDSTTYLSETESATAICPDLDAYDGLTDFAGDSGATEEIINESYQTIVTLNNPVDLAAFIGSGFVDFAFDASNSALTTIQVSGLVADVSTQIGGSILAEYDYTVPEPATLGLLVFGGAWLGWRKKR